MAKKKAAAEKAEPQAEAKEATVKLVTPNFVTRRIGDILQATGEEVSDKEKASIRNNTVALANGHPEFLKISAETPKAQRITPEVLADGLLKAHFVEKNIDLSAAEPVAKECLDAAMTIIGPEIEQEVRLTRWAQQSRVDDRKVPGIREINTGNMDLPRGFSFK